MSAPSRLSSVALLVFVLSTDTAGSESSSWTIEKDRTTPTAHGLYEIQQEAKAFLLKENERRGTDFYVGEPDARIWVPKCSVPLKAKWGMQKRTRLYTVVVSCRKAIPESYGKAKWDVDVSAFSAAEIAAHQARHKVLAASSPASR